MCGKNVPELHLQGLDLLHGMRLLPLSRLQRILELLHLFSAGPSLERSLRLLTARQLLFQNLMLLLQGFNSLVPTLGMCGLLGSGEPTLQTFMLLRQLRMLLLQAGELTLQLSVLTLQCQLICKLRLKAGQLLLESNVLLF